MYVLDVETMKVVMGNQAARKMAGFRSEGNGIGINPLDFVVPEDRAQVFEIATKDFQQDLRRTHEVRIITRDGGKGWISISAARITHDGRLAALISFIDITERKRMEKALRQSEENYRALFDSSVIGTFVLDAETMKVVMANEAAAKMFGLVSTQQAIETKLLDFVPPEDKDSVLTLIVKELFEQDMRRTHELQLLTKDGRRVWVSMTGARIIHGGRLAGLICFADITEQKRQNERLMMTDRLASIGELAAGAAHELNNPLSSIIGFSELLMEKDTPDYIRKDLAMIRSEAQRAANVTNNLLTFARKHRPLKQPTQINEVIEDALKLRAYAHKSNCILVERYLAPDLPEIPADHFQMQQVFLNIIINAEYFMTQANKKGKLTITTKRQDNSVIISFADDGPGIPAENLRRIFDPFFTTKDAGRGTGLGLSICHGIVTEHGGQIYATTQPGEGATILIELPTNGGNHSEAMS
jgi:two-component system NtrC family sensor kinase